MNMRSGSFKQFLGDVFAYSILSVGAVAMLYPLAWMMMIAMKPAEEALRYPPTFFPETLARGDWAGTLRQGAENFKRAWAAPPGEMTFGRYFMVSFLSAAMATLGTALTSILAAYPLACMNFRGRRSVFGAVLATLMIPSQVLMIPTYLILERLGWLDTYAALVVPFVASVFSIFLLRQFFMTVPVELWESAQLDGASRWTFLWSVLVPLARPVIVTVALLAFLGQWNSLLWPLIATTRPEMRTLMVGLQSFNQESVSEPNLLMAGAAFSMIPIMIVFFILQRQFMESIARTGIKG